MSVERRRGKWAYRFRMNGEVHFKSGFATAAEAEAGEAAHRLVLGTTITFTTLCDRRLAYVQVYCSSVHLSDTTGMLNYFRKLWAGLPIVSITREVVSSQVLKMAGEMSANNVNRHLRALKTLFQMAVDEGDLDRNPVKGIKFLPVAKAPRVVPTANEIREVILKARPEEQAFLTVLWLTAARVGEILSLTWEDVDFEEGTVRLWTNKSKGGNRVARVVPMLPQVRDSLKLLWKNRVMDSPYVFTSPEAMARYPEDKSRWKLGYPRKLMGRLTNRFTFHSLRHNTASTLAALGVELPAIQKVLGHSRPTTTDHYLAMMPQGVVTGMAKLGEYLEAESDAH
jgi:integrase